jgi:Na+/H+ antiporter NhaC
MTRVLPLAAFAVLVAGLFLLPRPDPARLAAAHAGKLLGTPASVAEDVDWRDLGVGDVVRVTRDGETREVAIEAVAGGEVTFTFGETTTTASSQDPTLEELVTRRPLWRYLVDPATADETEDGYRVRVRGGRMIGSGEDLSLHDDMVESVVRDLRAQTDELDQEIELDRRSAADHPGLLLRCELPSSGLLRLEVTLPDGRQAWVEEVWHPADGRSLLPPLVAILLAILLRQPVLALLAGVAVGSVLVLVVAGGSLLGSLAPGLADVGRKYLTDELLDTDRQMIVAFVIFMLAMVGVITKAGGIRGMMDRIAGLARDARRTQIATWFMGLAIFFDDYANSILVGTTMRPLSDKFKVAREKLAYIVDSTAAPVAGISILSTWIAFEVSTFSAQLPDAGLSPDDGYAIFLQTLPYRFYCLFTLFFVGLIVFSGRDFGPMLRAERRARGGQVLREGAQPLVGKAATQLQESPKVTPRASVALLPILCFVAVTLGYIVWAGGAFSMPTSELLTIKGMTGVLYEGSGFAPLMWGSLAGLVLAAVLAFGVGLRGEIVTSAWASLRSMGIAILILYLAWAIGAICGDLNTAEFLAVVLGDHINPLVLPVILFGLSGFVAFSTGSSWSTMTILLPLVVGLAYQMGQSLEGFGGELMVVISIGAVLEGAIWGDHCSPISDTTVMSSIATASDHVDHVRTQMPYAITTMVAAMLFGYLPAVILGLSPWISIALGCAGLTAFVYWKGERADDGDHGGGKAEAGGVA